MQRRHRLTASADFQGARQKGRALAGSHLVLHARPNDGQPVRVGISVGKRFGSAVARNRFKRRVREVVRHRLARLEPGWDLVFVARSGAATASFEDLELAIEGALRRAGLFASTRPDPGESGA